MIGHDVHQIIIVGFEQLEFAGFLEGDRTAIIIRRRVKSGVIGDVFQCQRESCYSLYWFEVTELKMPGLARWQCNRKGQFLLCRLVRLEVIICHSQFIAIIRLEVKVLIQPDRHGQLTVVDDAAGVRQVPIGPAEFIVLALFLPRIKAVRGRSGLLDLVDDPIPASIHPGQIAKCGVPGLVLLVIGLSHN